MERIQARLDRIYISERVEPFTFDWVIKESAIPTDHVMVCVRYTHKDAKNRSDLMKAKLANHGECLGGMWSALGKEKRPMSLIHRLRIPNTNLPQYE